MLGKVEYLSDHHDVITRRFTQKIMDNVIAGGDPPPSYNRHAYLYAAIDADNREREQRIRMQQLKLQEELLREKNRIRVDPRDIYHDLFRERQEERARAMTALRGGRW